ncbi:MAG TPA: CPBP family intramembrane metalloprotease [bacterium]|nr:CPBP family intramembrane metalloprotease [bacterium]
MHRFLSTIEEKTEKVQTPISYRSTKRRIFELLLLLLVFFIPGLIWQKQPAVQGNQALYMLQSITIALPQVLMIAYLLWIEPNQIDRKRTLAGLGITWPRWNDLLSSVAIYLGIAALLLVVSTLLALLPEKGRELLNTGFRWRLDDAGLIPLALVFCLSTAYREELFFRAYLLTRLEQLGLPAPIALILSTMLFAAGHLYQGFLGSIVALIIGFYFGLFFQKRRNLHQIALAHAFYNLSVLVLTAITDSNLV